MTNPLTSATKWRPKNRLQNVSTLIFVLFFAGIGTYILFHSFAASNNSQNMINKGNSFNKLSEDPKAIKLRWQLQTETQNLSVFIKASKGHPKNPANDAAELIKLSKQRFNNMKKLLKIDPAGAEENLLPSDVIQTGSRIKGAQIEQLVTLNGQYVSSDEHHVDIKGNHTADFEHNYMYINGKNWNDTKRYDLYSSDPQAFDSFKTSQTIYTQGFAFDDQVFAQSVKHSSPVGFSHSPLGRFASSLVNIFKPAKAEAISTGTIKVAVIAIQCQGAQPINMTAVHNVFQDTPGHNVVDYYQQVSNGKAVLVPDFYGPYIMPSSISCFDSQQFEDQAYQLANADVNYLNYNRIAIVVDGSQWPDGRGAGVGKGGPEHQIATPDGNITAAQAIYFDLWGYLDAAAHELGHDFGTGHADYYNCTPDAFDPPTRFDANCGLTQYGDAYDIMGHSGLASNSSLGISSDYAGEMDSLFKNLIGGWFNTGNVQTISSPGTYTKTLVPIENNTSSLQTLNIPRGDGTSFWLDYRQPLSYDNYLLSSNTTPGGRCSTDCSAITKGPEIHYSNGGSESMLIDTTPYSLLNWDPMDAALAPGKTFTDPGTGTTITTNSADANGTTVTVTIPSAACTRGVPTVTVSNPTQSVSPGQTITYNATIKNNDSSGCLPDKFRTGDINYNLPIYTTPSILTLNPGGSANFTVSLVDAPGSGVTNTTTTLPMAACGNYAAAACGNYQITYTQTTPNDSNPPSIPTNVTATGLGSNRIQLSWSPSSDTVGVSYYTIYRNGARIVNLSANQGTTYYDGGAAGSSYSYTVSAGNYANVSSAQSAVSNTVTLPAQTDVNPPSGVTNVHFNVQDAHTVTVSWTPATDNVGVAEYSVCAASCHYLPATATSFTDTYLQASTKYTYNITAADGAGNSQANDTLNSVVYTPKEGTLPPSTPQAIKHVGVSPIRDDIFYTASTGSGPINYTYFSGTSGGFRAVMTNPYPAFSNALTEYNYDWVQAIDSNGNISQSQYSVGFVYGPTGLDPTDTTPPTSSITSPAGGAIVSGNNVLVAATGNDNKVVYGMELYVDNQMVDAIGSTTNGPSLSSTLTFDSTRFSDGTHALMVKAFDKNDNAGASSTVNITINNSTTTKPGDINGDTKIDILDLSILATNFGACGKSLNQGDLSGDGCVNILDLSILAANWGK